MLDFTVASDVLGKPAMADVSLGLSTAPVLYAAETEQELVPLIKRKFKVAPLPTNHHPPRPSRQ